MLNAPLHLHPRQPLIHDSAQLKAKADTLLAHSRASVACGKAYAVARTRAARTDAAPPALSEHLREAYHDGWANMPMPPDKGETMAPHTALTILIVDDEPGFASGLARLLRCDGGTVDTAANGSLALAHLQARRYDVVLCDLRMPALDGPDFYAILRRQHASLCRRVIFLTGDNLGAESTAFLEQCGQPWVYKPCTATAIREAIQQMLHAVEIS